MARSLKRIIASVTTRTFLLPSRAFSTRSLTLRQSRKSLSSLASARASVAVWKRSYSEHSHSNIGQESGGGYLQTGHRRDQLFDPTVPPRILVTGASGQIGSELVPYLRARYGAQNVIASDVKMPQFNDVHEGPFVYTDVTDYNQLARVVLESRIDWVFHLAALLSAVGERQPQLAMKINNTGVENILELSKLNQLRCYIPSSIAAFGPTTPQDEAPNLTIMRPTTIYGITKVYSELLGEYYHSRYGVDFRSLRYPGIISNKAAPGGGTTDYAVEIYHEALRAGKYKCFLSEDSKLPMLYMPDCLRATIELMECDEDKLEHRVYNLGGISFTPQEQAESIKKIMPNFKMDYKPDFRQNIAKSWPGTLDDTPAQKDWGWKPQFGLDDITVDMLKELKLQYEREEARKQQPPPGGRR